MNQMSLEQVRILFFESQSFAEKIQETYLEPNAFHCETVSTKSQGLFMEIIQKCEIEMAFFSFDEARGEALLHLLGKSKTEKPKLKRVLFLEKDALGQVPSGMEELIDEFIVRSMDIQEFAIRFRKLHRAAMMERNMISQEELIKLLSSLGEAEESDDGLFEEEAQETLPWDAPLESLETEPILEEEKVFEAKETKLQPSMDDEAFWSWEEETEELLEPKASEETLEAVLHPEEAEVMESSLMEEPPLVEEPDTFTEVDAPLELEEEVLQSEESPEVSSDDQEELNRMLEKLLEEEALEVAAEEGLGAEEVLEAEETGLHDEKLQKSEDWHLKSGYEESSLYDDEESEKPMHRGMTSAAAPSVEASESVKAQGALSAGKSKVNYEEDIRVTIMGLNENKKKSLLKRVVGGVIGAIGVGGLVYTVMIQIGF